jgi:hypothetical protein
VVIRDLNLVDISSLPSETDPILIINSDTVLSAPVRPQPFQAISWWYSELSEIFHAINLIEFPSGHLPQISGTGFSAISESTVQEKTNHRITLPEVFT